MPAPRKYPNELRERSVRLVVEAMAEEPSLSLNAAVLRIGPRVGVNPDTARIKELERENRDLKRANEILLAARRTQPVTATPWVCCTDR